MDKNDIPEITTLNWIDEDGIVILNTGLEKIMINKTSSIIWNKINGIDTVQGIIDEMVTEYGKENSEEYLAEIVESAINEFIINKIAIIKTSNEFDGWLQYE
jgi:hypothetical protein